MRYVSTRGRADELGFEEVMLAGLARDGGLYVPKVWPVLADGALDAMGGADYSEIALAVLQPFVGDDIPQDELADIIGEAYATFEAGEVAPLHEIGPDMWVLELFHGPTLAFKDIAMQLLARLMDRALAKRNRRLTIIGATSGDTGGAAIEAFRGSEAVDIFILHPEGRVSDVQRRQMTSAQEPNVFNIAIEGTFDDCQALVKALFNDLALRDRLSLAGVNSINWARIMAQTVYYVSSALAIGQQHWPAVFAVPTGNFGDIFAGYVAARMGLPISRLVIATNENDILARTLKTGRYEPQGVRATSSPSMDIQVSSNFERLLFEVSGRDGRRVHAMMEDLGREGTFELAAGELEQIRAQFSAHRIDEAETAATIAKLYETSGYLIDPHTAVGVAAALREQGARPGPVVVLGTAHPAKFPEAVEAACGAVPQVPERLSDKLTAEERFVVMANDAGSLARYLEDHARAKAEPGI